LSGGRSAAPNPQTICVIEELTNISQRTGSPAAITAEFAGIAFSFHDTLALVLAGDIYVVLADTTASVRIGALGAAAALAFLVGLWHAFPVVSRLRRH
jgi:hypothetical protein